MSSGQLSTATNWRNDGLVQSRETVQSNGNGPYNCSKGLGRVYARRIDIDEVKCTPTSLLKANFRPSTVTSLSGGARRVFKQLESSSSEAVGAKYLKYKEREDYKSWNVGRSNICNGASFGRAEGQGLALALVILPAQTIFDPPNRRCNSIHKAGAHSNNYTQLALKI